MNNFVFQIPKIYMLQSSPYLLYSDGKGNTFEDTSLYAVGRSGWDAMPVDAIDWIELPTGGSLYELPGRRGIGVDVLTGELKLCTKGWAVAAFIPPAYTGLFIAAFETEKNAPTLPLFCYTAVGWYNNTFFVTATRIENDIRQESEGFNASKIKLGVEKIVASFPNNRLVQHLANNCCNTYQCPAARNFFLGRWECPIPSSPACNANCVGCISFQPETESITSTQDRLTFKPTAEEIIEFTVPHLQNAPYPIVSFGQGCEGEPLLMSDTIEMAIKEIRKHTNKGSININTNGSRPKDVERLAIAGLDSIRVSTNSVLEKIYTPYYRPNNYHFNDIKESVKIMTHYNKWSSLNYFVFPGMTDREEEYEALRDFIKETGLKMIQWRNFNIDPDWYLGLIKVTDMGPTMGIKQMMELLAEEFTELKFGYFNPSMERIKGNFTFDFAH
jgi:pyruvate-formate lyase-activating enzyme